MVEGHARCARGLKPRALARGVGSFEPYGFTHNQIRYLLDSKDVHSPGIPGKPLRILKKKDLDLFI